MWNEADQRYLYAHHYSGVINLHTGITDIPVIDADGRAERGAEFLKVLGSASKVAVVSDEKQIMPVLDKLPANVRIVARERIGHRGMVLLCSWGEASTSVEPPRRH